MDLEEANLDLEQKTDEANVDLENMVDEVIQPNVDLEQKVDGKNVDLEYGWVRKMRIWKKEYMSVLKLVVR